MKKVLALLVISLGILSFKTNGNFDEKKYKVELSQQDWLSRYSSIGIAVNALRQSNLPANVVLPLCDSLGKFYNEIAIQLQPQFLAQAKQDSINHKK